MYIETYYDENSTVLATSGEPAIPYPELTGEELRLWQRYLPAKTPLKDVAAQLIENTPHLVIEELEKAQQAARWFDHVEIWSRSDDPMAVGVREGKPTRYFCLSRWGDAELTLDQVKETLRLEKWLTRLIPLGLILLCLLGAVALMTYAKRFPELAENTFAQGELFDY
jgi:hypothetical protein